MRLPVADLNQSTQPPAFNAPAVVIGLVGALVGVHLLASFMDPAEVNRLVAYFALSPARYAPSANGDYLPLPGGLWVDMAGFVTHIFIHANWEHLIFNSVWLLVFGAPVARRFGTIRFLLFFIVCGILGGLTHVVIHAGELAFVVGASGAISGLMGGAARFVFLAGGPLGLLTARDPSLSGAPRAQATILQALTDRRTLMFVAVWLGVNVLFGVAGLSLSGDTVSIAWEAHLGGFVAGLLLFGLFDPMKQSPSGGPGNVGYGEWRGD
jgi:membrane associated rhomboid family serine protease